MYAHTRLIPVQSVMQSTQITLVERSPLCSRQTIHIVQQRFFQYKYENGISMSTFLSKIEELKNQLKQMGESVSEKFVITKVLMSLPADYKHFVSAWESAPEEKQTYDNLVARLLIEEERIKDKEDVSQQSETSAAAFFANKLGKKNVKCYKYSKLGHFQSECKSNRINNNNSNSNERPVKKCYYCKKVGHIKSECWFKKNKEKDNNASNAFVISSGQFQKSQWLVDTGASQHMCHDRNLFATFFPLSNKSVIVGNGDSISAHGCGKVALQVHDGKKWIDTTIDNVLFVPELKTNLFSVNCVTDRGYVMITNDNKCKFLKQNKVCAVANRIGDMYFLDVRYKCEGANVAQVQSSLKEWHERLAHQNLQHVKAVLRNNNISVKDNTEAKCESCLQGKISRLPFHTSETKTTRPCELIHADTCGPMEVPSVGGSRYFVIMKDDYSNYRSVYFIKRKDEVKKCIENFINKAENTTNNKIHYFRSDNGLEYVNKGVQDLFADRGIIHQTTVPYTPEQNGKSERENRTLVEAARTMICAKGLPKKLWAEAVQTAAYVLNRTSKSNDPGKTPFEVWTNKHFDINDLKIFGTPVFVHIPKEKRRKWDAKGEKGIMVGYGEDVKGYRVFFGEKNSVEIKRDIVFLEQPKTKTEQLILLEHDTDILKGFDMDQACKEQKVGKENKQSNESEEQLEDTLDLSTESNRSEYVPCSSDESSDAEEDEPSQRPRSTRSRKQTSFYKCHYVSTEENEPKTYQEAMQRHDARKWQEAIESELQTLNENKTWDFCEKPVSEKAVSSNDTCLYMKHTNSGNTYVLLYVDDLLIFGNNENEISDLKSLLNSEFKMKDLGLENCNSVIDKNIENKCRKIIGKLSYAALGTRPDICVAVSILSRYQNKANKMLLMALKRCKTNGRRGASRGAAWEPNLRLDKPQPLDRVVRVDNNILQTRPKQRSTFDIGSTNHSKQSPKRSTWKRIELLRTLIHQFYKMKFTVLRFCLECFFMYFVSQMIVAGVGTYTLQKPQFACTLECAGWCRAHRKRLSPLLSPGLRPKRARESLHDIEPFQEKHRKRQKSQKLLDMFISGQMSSAPPFLLVIYYFHNLYRQNDRLICGLPVFRGIRMSEVNNVFIIDAQSIFYLDTYSTYLYLSEMMMTISELSIINSYQYLCLVTTKSKDYYLTTFIIELLIEFLIKTALAAPAPVGTDVITHSSPIYSTFNLIRWLVILLSYTMVTYLKQFHQLLRVAQEQIIEFKIRTTSSKPAGHRGRKRPKPSNRKTKRYIKKTNKLKICSYNKWTWQSPDHKIKNEIDFTFSTWSLRQKQCHNNGAAPISYSYTKRETHKIYRRNSEKRGGIIEIKRGVRQGDALLSPKLFIAVLEQIFKKIHWERKGIQIQKSLCFDAYLFHLALRDRALRVDRSFNSYAADSCDIVSMILLLTLCFENNNKEFILTFLGLFDSAGGGGGPVCGAAAPPPSSQKLNSAFISIFVRFLHDDRINVFYGTLSARVRLALGRFFFWVTFQKRSACSEAGGGLASHSSVFTAAVFPYKGNCFCAQIYIVSAQNPLIKSVIVMSPISQPLRQTGRQISSVSLVRIIHHLCQKDSNLPQHSLNSKRALGLRHYPLSCLARLRGGQVRTWNIN
ncbi:hypothetical protein ABMA27_015057 [Loxostege sticticalis]|uniref:Retrovirus-related Pol polyprotein from transposon TNT 1-94 n=1 Tax=Loxostege sticticalis TaxID=481309 RepID=A0ABR3I6B5_LOXSC